jgi:hypothetical protein
MKRMRIQRIACLLVLISVSCANPSAGNKDHVAKENLAIANHYVDAFYSFNSDSLKSLLSEATESQPNILYYQKWAECGHYIILKRDAYGGKNDSVVVVPVTVKDDLMAALKIDFNVTDTFHIVIKDKRIRSITNSSNDPDEYYKAKKWVKENRADLIDKPCEGIWNGGPTPCECIRGMLKGFGEYAAEKR